MNEQIIVEMIEYYYPDIELIDRKIIHNIGCVLWNKKKELDTFLLHKNRSDLNELYRDYCESFKKKRIVSKQYFVNYATSL